MSPGVSLMLKSGNPSLVFRKLPSSSNANGEFHGDSRVVQEGIWLQFHFEIFSGVILVALDWRRTGFPFTREKSLMRDDLFLEIDLPIGNRGWSLLGFASRPG